MFWLYIALFVLSFGQCSGQCAESIRDFSAAISDQYANVDFGANQTCKRNGKDSPLSSIISNALKSDLCDLETIAKDIENKTQVLCPACDPLELSCNYTPNDVVFLIDTSATLNNGQFANTLNFVAGLINEMAGNNDTFRVATIFYSFDAVVRFDLSVYINNLTAAAEDVKAYDRVASTTNLFKALDFTLSDIFNGNPGDRSDVQDVVIMVTDGESTSPANTITSYNALLAALPDLRYVSIGTVAGLINATELEFLSTDPLEENLFIFENIGALLLSIRQVMGTFCNVCSPVCRNGGECIKNSNTCTCPDGFVGSRCQSQSLCTT